MPSEAPNFCVCIATNTGCQGAYVGTISFVLVLILVTIVLEFVIEGGADISLIGLLMWLSAMISGSFMMASRLCSKSCCPGGLEAVPACCPCTCFSGLDIPYYMWYGLMAVVGTARVILQFVTSAEDTSHLKLLRILRLFDLVNFVIIIVAFICAIVKLSAMMGCCCKEMVPQSGTQPSAQAPGQEVIVGLPVSVDEKNTS